jgi:hypothetical protein
MNSARAWTAPTFFGLGLLAIVVFVPAWRHVTVPILVGMIGGTLLRIIVPVRPQEPLEPIGRGWQVVWWILVGLLIASLFDPIARYFAPALAITVLWGWSMYRYRKQRGVQG